MKIIVFGAGQLAQMMYLAAVPLGVEVQAFDVNSRKLVNPVSKRTIKVSVDEAFADARVVSAEFEHVPEDLLLMAENLGKLYPSKAAILTGADRVREKALLQKAGVANADYLIIDEIEKLDQCVNVLGEKVIFKASRDGYDGYGQWRMSKPEDLDKIKRIFTALDLAAVPVVAEKMIPFDRELSIVGTRDKKGNTSLFSLAENIHHEGQLHVSIAPAPKISDELQAKAEAIFNQIAQALSYVGVLAVEMFQVGDELMVNEIAPRVHNSGHWTQNGAETSQFEQHIRAVLDFPLGESQHHKITAMVNIIGCTSFSRDLISIPGCHLHWYGKSVRDKRKMGHINLTADTYEELSDKLARLKSYLPVDFFPKLDGQILRLKSE